MIDRDHAIDVLKVAFVQGRLSMDEFDARIGQVLTSRTQAELATVTDDIPAGLAGVRRPPRPSRHRMSSAARWGTSGFITPGVLAAGLAASSLSGSASWTVMAIVVALGYFIVWLSAGAELLWQWHSMCVPSAGMCVRCAHPRRLTGRQPPALSGPACSSGGSTARARSTSRPGCCPRSPT